MPVTREGPDLHGLVTVLSTHSVPVKPFMHGQSRRLIMAVIEERERRIVGGVDTHKDLHVAAVVDEQDQGPAGGPFDERSIPSWFVRMIPI